MAVLQNTRVRHCETEGDALGESRVTVLGPRLVFGVDDVTTNFGKFQVEDDDSILRSDAAGRAKSRSRYPEVH